ncbi:protein timeless-like [Dreissena polymorpha]|uniref:Timeless n=1 Tax=Dreissena polymorpha TaxID=45954 RepID=A0A9D4KFM7_DREPO|nr:protein timeless-like [Dreissena polymorpha]XP_052280055.1 protein timeless-like [Dreissena polymorpha]KAH3839015.1 hypothetical protein DPMN_112435 [Dreissena polymorpha]
MEWAIMNFGGLNGLMGTLGYVEEDQYIVDDDCLESLEMMLCQLEEDDPVRRETLRQMANSNIIQKELVPLVSHLKDDPDIFHMAIKLLVALTRPVECLQQEITKGHSKGHAKVTNIDLPWVEEVGGFLGRAKSCCANAVFIRAIYTEVKKIISDSGEYDLLEEDCQSIKTCLVLLRNLLHVPSTQTDGGQNDIHLAFLSSLLENGLDDLVLTLLNTKQKEYWGATLVQLVSLLYRDLVGEVFLALEDMGMCDADSCDSATCSHCENSMDRCMLYPGKLDHNTQTENGEGWSDISGSQAGQDRCKSVSEQTVKCEQRSTRTCGSSLLESFGTKCRLSNEDVEANARKLAANKHGGSGSGIVRSNSANSMSDNSTIQASETEKMATSESSMERKSSGYGTNSFVDNTCDRLVDFTNNFLENGVSNLVNILQDEILAPQSSSELDDSYFLWSVAFFLKFARRKEIEFRKIRDILTEDVFGFLVYEAVSNGEEVMHAFKNENSYELSMRRLHLAVTALREMIKTMTFHIMKGLAGDDLTYIQQLQGKLANMTDLRQSFLWLLKTYEPGCHSNLYLRDIIVTNHYFLLLLEDWLARGLCDDRSVTMISHIKQFSQPALMLKYSQLLQRYGENDHHVNNCAFTMMYHVAGDCKNHEALMHPEILQTFINILDSNLPLTYEMNDLMEYIIQKFLALAETDPLVCAVNFGLDNISPPNERVDMDNDSDALDHGWTIQEIDLLTSWWGELEGRSDAIDEVARRLLDKGIRKLKIEVVNQLYKMDWLSESQLERFIATEKGFMQQTVVKNYELSTKGDQFLSALEELSQMEEEKVVPFCLRKLEEEGYDKQLQHVRNCLLETAFVKSGAVLPGSRIEPVIKYFALKKKDVPVVMYNEEQVSLMQNPYMIGLLEQLGLHVDEEGLRFPRIPADVEVAELLQMAGKISKLDDEMVQCFNHAMSGMEKFTDVKETTDLNEKKPSRQPFQTPAVGWMKLVSSYNKAETSTGSYERMDTM